MHGTGSRRSGGAGRGAGLGFAKGSEGNLQLLSGLPRLRRGLRGALRHAPLLVGPSRKTFLGLVTGGAPPPHFLRHPSTSSPTRLPCFLAPGVHEAHPICRPPATCWAAGPS